MTSCNTPPYPHNYTAVDGPLYGDGFTVLRGVLTPAQVRSGRAAYLPDGNVDYKAMSEFVMDHMLPALGTSGGGVWSRGQPVAIKYRASDNNNSTDASTLHRDVWPLQPRAGSGVSAAPCFTLLAYLDGATVEVVPGSHREPAMRFGRALSAHRERVRVPMVPGDLIVFNSALLHRGIFTWPSKHHRRLVQAFDVYPSAMERDDVKRARVMHLPRHTSAGPTIRVVAAIPPALALANAFAYFNAAMGYGRPTVPETAGAMAPDKLGRPRFTHVSSEGAQGRYVAHVHGEIARNNMYVLLGHTEDASVACARSISWNSYQRPFSVCAFMTFLVLLVIAMGLFIAVRGAVRWFER